MASQDKRGRYSLRCFRCQTKTTFPKIDMQEKCNTPPSGGVFASALPHFWRTGPAAAKIGYEVKDRCQRITNTERLISLRGVQVNWPQAIKGGVPEVASRPYFAVELPPPATSWSAPKRRCQGPCKAWRPHSEKRCSPTRFLRNCALKRGSWSLPVGSPNIRGRGALTLSMPLLCPNGNRGSHLPLTPLLEPLVSHFPLTIQGRYALVVYCLKPRVRGRQGATVKGGARR